MSLLRIAVFGAVAVLSLPRAVAGDSLLVRSVVDGGTIDVAGVGHVRLLGIVAPAQREAAAALAREKLAQLVWRRFIRLEIEPGARSRRHAYVVREDGLFVNAAMLREGLARVDDRVSLTRLAELTRAEAEARSSRRGIWMHR